MFGAQDIVHVWSTNFYCVSTSWDTRLHILQDPTNLIQAINKGPSGIQPQRDYTPTGKIVASKVEPTLLKALFPLTERNATMKGVSSVAPLSLLGLGDSCRHLSTQAPSTRFTWIRVWSPMNKHEQSKQKNWQERVPYHKASSICLHIPIGEAIH
jgi:hypothetical protein